MLKQLAILSPTLLCMVMSMEARADTGSVDYPVSTWGRALVSSTAVSGNFESVGADVMLPFYRTLHGFFYGDAAGNYGSDATYVMSPGLGYRGVVNNQIFGAYFFDDYQKTSLGTNFWVLSPGVEWITPRWDFHFNAYFPTTKTEQNGSAYFADTQGDYSGVSYTEGTHNGYDTLVTPYAVLGNGVDTALGYSFDQNSNHLRSRVFVGSYYYQPPSGDNVENIIGGTVGYSQAITEHLSFAVTNSYDQVNHDNFGINVTYVFGGHSNTFSNNVTDRLYDNVNRHIGIIDTAAGQYDQQSYSYQEHQQQYDNLYFIAPEAEGAGDGTYGNAMALTQTGLDTAYSQSPEGVRFYIQGGDNAIYSLSYGEDFTSDALEPYSGQDFYGRTIDYTAPAAGEERPTLLIQDGYSGFELSPGENTFSDLIINSNSTAQVDTSGIYFQNSSSTDNQLTLTDTSISGFVNGIYLNNLGSGNMWITLNQSQFNDNGVDAINAVSGLSAINQGEGAIIINASDTTFNNNTATMSGATSSGIFLDNEGSGNIALVLNAVEANANNAIGGSGTEEGGIALGLYAANHGSGKISIESNSSAFNSNYAEGNGALAAGLYAYNSSNGLIQVTTNSSSFNNNSGINSNAGLEASVSSAAAGLILYNAGNGWLQLTTNHSTFNANGGDESGAGIGVVIQNTNGYVTMVSSDTEFSQNTSTGLLVYNASSAIDTTQITIMNGSFVENGLYGVANVAGEPDAATSINFFDTIFVDNGVSDVNWTA